MATSSSETPCSTPIQPLAVIRGVGHRTSVHRFVFGAIRFCPTNKEKNYFHPYLIGHKWPSDSERDPKIRTNSVRNLDSRLFGTKCRNSLLFGKCWTHGLRSLLGLRIHFSGLWNWVHWVKFAAKEQSAFSNKYYRPQVEHSHGRAFLLLLFSLYAYKCFKGNLSHMRFVGPALSFTFEFCEGFTSEGTQT